MNIKWIISSCLLISLPTSARIGDSVLSMIKDETLSAVTSESMGMFKSLESIIDRNEVRIMKAPNSVRVSLTEPGEYKLGLFVMDSGGVYLTNDNDLWLPPGLIALTFLDNEGNDYPYRYSYIPKTDETVMISGTPSVTANQRDKHQVPLTVKTYPSDATVKIMNIVPKYQDGMVLRESRYDILVQRQGYYSFRTKHDLKWDMPTLHIVLRKM
ncbi:hypothetical protein [Vibrio sp. MA40-2]|uniref:hypothetical protein n=1 Tax=Vibrio sp. MA40-2 TaxID=3391828 RepID=UPI0039A460BF